MHVYTLGLAFAERSDSEPLVLMVEKGQGRPHAGRWNGLGGGLNLGEKPADGVSREVKEESGIGIPASDWIHFGILEGVDWMVYLYAHQMPPERALNLSLYAAQKHPEVTEFVSWRLVRDVASGRIDVPPDFLILLTLARKALVDTAKNEPILYARLKYGGNE